MLSDDQIFYRIKINPLDTGKKKVGKISYGMSSYGYDARLGYDFKIFHRASGIIDPKKPDFDCEDVHTRDFIVIPPNSFALGVTYEDFKIPRDILALCIGKSTYARCGIIVNVTPLEPEWEGTITVEISNTTPSPVKVYAGEGIMQVIFFEASEVCRASYQDKGGKYQGQVSLTLPRMD